MSTRIERSELQRRAEMARELLSRCELCPQKCRVNRLAGELGVCGIGRHARVASHAPHFGEESVLTGITAAATRHTGARGSPRCAGSGTIFFSGCNLLCVFCQNHDISHQAVGQETPADRLAALMLGLQASGCCNINLVTPSHVIPQILEAIAVARRDGLRVPIVYNSSGYDRVETLQLLDGVVDIYMPDIKFHRDEGSAYLSGPVSYGEAAEMAVSEMHRQVGDLRVEGGIAVRGLLVRHLVMPRGAADSAGIFGFLASLSPDTYINIMDQYRPLHAARFHPVIGAPTTAEEHREAVELARAAGLWRIEGE